MSTGESDSYGKYYTPSGKILLTSKAIFWSFCLWNVSKSCFKAESDFLVSFYFFYFESEMVFLDEFGLENNVIDFPST